MHIDIGLKLSSVLSIFFYFDLSSSSDIFPRLLQQRPDIYGPLQSELLAAQWTDKLFENVSQSFPVPSDSIAPSVFG